MLLGFGSLPTGVSEGSPAQATVSIVDDPADVSSVQVSFEQAAYSERLLDEGSSVTVTVELSQAPERTVVVPITAAVRGGATAADYSGVPASVTFASGDTEKAFTFAAASDDADDDDESVLLGFGSLPTGVSAGSPAQATVSIVDDPADVPSVTVSFEQAAYTVDEGSSVTVTVELSQAPERTVVVPITAAGQGSTTAADYSVAPTSVTFASGDTEQTFTLAATADTDDDDNESVLLGFGTLPTGVSEGSPAQTTVSIVDDPADVPSVTVSFGASAYSVDEGSSVTVTVELSQAPEREVVVPITATGQAGAGPSDYSVAPTGVTFAPGDTEQTLTFTATADTDDDDNESVLLSFGTLPTGVAEGSPDEATVSIVDDPADVPIVDDPADVPSVTASFAASTYTVDEGSSVTVTVELSEAPEREVVVPITATGQAGAGPSDYSGAPTGVTFASGDTEQTFTIAATADTDDDDNESVLLGFGTLPTAVSEGSPAQATVLIVDDPADVPSVQVSFEQATYAVDEGSSVTVTVELSQAPERTVVVPITATGQAGAGPSDYSVAPTSVTFASGDTEQTFTLAATADTDDDDNESVLLGFGTLPTGVSEGSPAQTTVSIIDDPADVPSVQVSFEQAAYSVDEGSSVTVTVELSQAPEREVVVPITATGQAGAGPSDYSVAPTGVTFAPGDTEQTLTFTATADTVDDDNESVLLGFGSLPTGVSAPATTARPATATVAINDNDDPPDVPSVTVAFEKSDHPTVEGARVGVSLTLSAAPQADTTIEIMVLPESTASTSDYRVSTRPVFDAGDTDYVQLPANEKFNVTFVAGETSTNFGISILPDTLADEGVERIVLGFGALPTGILQGSLSTTTVTIRDGEDDNDNDNDNDGDGNDTDDDGDANAVPTFSSPASFSVAENRTAAGTVAASDNDSGDTMTGYALGGGADQTLFSIGSTSGVLTFDSAPNYEAPKDADTDNAYLVEVRATGGAGDREQTATQTITVTVLDANEQPDKPAKPALAAVSGSATSLAAVWTKPGLNGGPDITGYNVNYRVSTATAWENFTHSGTGVTRTITGLTASTSYQVRVQALNGETPSAWSDPSDAVSTDAETIIPPGPAGTNPVLPPPQDVNAEPKLPGEIRLSWWRNPDAPSHELVDSHQYRYRVRDAGAWTVDWTTVSQTLIPDPWPAEIRNANQVLLLQGLTAWTTYEFQVRSVDEDGGTSVAVSVLGTAIGGQTVWIEADTRSVREGASLRFTLSRDQPHGRLMVIVRISETGDMLPPEGRSPEGDWHEQVYFGDGNATIPLVLQTVNDLGGPEPDSAVTVEVMPYPLGGWDTLGNLENPDNEHLYDVQSELRSATITVTASDSWSPGGAAEPLTAAFEGLPATHDGETAFTFRIAFSEAVSVTPEAMRTRVLTVAGGAVTGATRVAGESGAWSIAVTPDSREELSIALAPAADCEADGAVCTSDGRALSNGAAHIVSGPGPDTGPAPLTATFPESVYASAKHKGPSDRPQVVVAFSAPVEAFEADTPSVSATGASVDSVQRLDKEGLEHAYVFFLTPEGHKAIVFRVHANRACTDGGICAADRRRLSNSPSATVPGPSDDAPEPNTAAAGAPTIGGTPRVGEELTASTSGISDADGLDNASFAYQWIRASTDIDGAIASTYTPVAADEGERLKVRVSFTDDAGNGESLVSAATAAVAAAPPTNTAAAGAPTIGGTAQVGEELTASTSGISDADGLDDADFAHQWIRASADIDGATGSTYTPVAADEGERLKVRVGFTDDAGNGESLVSAATDAVAAAPPTNTAAAGAPTIGGTPRVGEELSASTSGISDADGLDDADFAHQWIRASADIDGATGSTYTAVAADEGERLKVRVGFTDDAGNDESLVSAATAAVAAAPPTNTAATGAPTIGGTPRVGEELSASTSGISDADGLDDADFAHQWIRDDADIDGATGSTYTPVDGRRGREAQGPGGLHRRRRQRGAPRQRGDRCGRRGAGAADGGVRGHAGRARRPGVVPLPGGVQRRDQDQLQDAARRVVRGDGR